MRQAVKGRAQGTPPWQSLPARSLGLACSLARQASRGTSQGRFPKTLRGRLVSCRPFSGGDFFGFSYFGSYMQFFVSWVTVGDRTTQDGGGGGARCVLFCCW